MKAIKLNTNLNGRATGISGCLHLLSLCLSIIAPLVFAGNFAFAQAQSSSSLLKGDDKVSNDIKEMLHNYDQKIYFTENKGQWPNNVLYKADFHLGQAIATKDGMLVGTFDPADVDAKQTWSIREEEAIRSGAKFNEPEPGTKGHGWLMNFVNHSPEMSIETKDKHTDVFNYFYGKSTAQTGVNNYQEIWYKNVYNNVDVRYYPSKTGTLEYDVVCKPGFHKDEIAIQLTGIDKITVGKDGHLVFKTSVGDMDFPAPVAYQKGADKKQVPVKIQYYITDNNVLHFTLGKYDESKTLIIDPIALRWATWMTNNSAAADHGHCIWVDPSDGGIYVVSRFAGAGLITVNAFQNNFAGGSSYDLCIGKYYEPTSVGGSGTRVWQTYLGGTGEDNPYSIIQGLDSAIYITGYTGSTDFPLIGGTKFGTSANSVNNSAQSANNIFITKIWKDGQSIKTAIVGGNGDDYSYDIGMDSYGDLTICGYTESSNLQTLFPATNASNTNNGGMDVLIFQVTSNLETINWMRNYGGNGDDVATILQQNPVTNEIYVAGYTESPSGKKNTVSFPVSSNARQKTIGGSEDGFIQKLSSTGSTIWSSYFNSASGNNTQILCMQFNTTDNVLYFGGLTNGLGTNNTPSGTYQTSVAGGQDFFCAAMDTNQTFVASTYIGGASDEANLMGLNVDLNNDVYLFGYTPSTNFPVTSDALQSTNYGNDDKVFFKLNTGLTSLMYSTYYGGTNDDYDPVGERGIKFSNCRIYTIVTAESPNIPLTQGAITTHKLSSTSIYEPGIVEWSNPPDMSGNSLSGNQSLCAGEIPTNVTGTAPTYSLPNIVRYSSTGSGADSTSSSYPVTFTTNSTYQWQESTDSINWTSITGGTNQNLSGSLIGAVYKTTFLRRLIGGDACVVSPAASQIITINVLSVTANVNNGCYNQNNGSITITSSTGTAPYTYSWSNGATTQTRTGLASGTYKVTVTDHAACTASGSFTISNPTHITATATSTTTPNCESIATASVTVSGGTSPYTYSWSNGDIQPNIFNLPAGTYTVTVTDADGCTPTSSTTISGKAPPPIAVNSPSICGGSSVTLTASGAASYTWTPSTNLSGTTGASVTANPTTTTTYNVTGTASNGCTASAMSTVVVNYGATCTASGGTTVCAGSPCTLTASCSGSGSETSGINYTWSPTYCLNQSTGASCTASPTTTTTFTVIGTNSSGCTGSASVVVTCTPLPVVNVSVTSGNATYCTSGSATLTATGATTYTWAPNVALSGTTGASVTANPTVTTTYTVTGTTGNCYNTATIVVTVNIPVQVAVTSPTTCKNIPVNITASGVTSYVWTPSTDLNQTTGATVSAVNPTVTTSYTVTGTDANGCTSTAVSKLTVNTPVQVTVSSPTTCKNIAVNITASGVTSYIWTPSTDLNQTTGATVSAVNPTVTTSYTVTGTDANGCTSTAVSTLTVNTPVQVTVSSPTTCKNIAVNITASGVTSYIWTPSTDLNQTTGATVSAVNPTATTSYTVTGTDANGCTSTAVSTLTVNTPVQVTVSSPTTCKNIAVNITASGESSYTWVPSTGLNQTTGATVSVTNPTVTTSYTVTGTDGNGCTSIATSKVTVNTPVQVTVSSPTTCKNIAMNITASGESSYTWSPSTGLIQTTGATVSVTNPTATTSYTVTGTDGNGCTSTAISTVTVNTPVQVTVSSPTTCKNIAANITASGESSYTWAPSAGLSATTGATVSVTNPTATTSYTVTGTDGNGCTSTAVSTVTVNTPVQVTVSSPTTCKNIAVNITASGESSYAWAPSSGLNQTTGAAVSVTNPTATTSYTVTGTDANGCTSTAVSTVTVNTPMQVTVSSPTTCKNIAVNITASGESSYTWAPSAGLNQTTGATVSVTNPTATTSYTVTGTDGNGCTSTAVSTVTVNTPVQVTVSSPTTCKNIAVNITASGESSYKWAPSTGLNQTTGATVSVTNPIATSSYTVTGTDGNGCTSTAVSTVMVNTPVQVTVSSPTTCKNIAVNIPASGESSYTWAPSAGLNQTTGATVSVTNPTATTSYTVTGTDGNGCTSTAVSTVTVNTPVQVTVSSPTTCKNIAVNITASGESSYTWAPSTGLNQTTGATVSVTNPTATTSYTVTGTDGNGCTSTAVSTVTVNTPVQVTVSSPTTCKNIAVNITASGESSYIWAPSTGLNQTTGAILSVTNPTATTSYTVTGTDGNGCTSTAVSTVTVNTPVQVAVSSPTTCKNIAVNITASGESSYSWSPSTGLNQTTGAIVSVTNPTATSSYTVTGTDGNGCTSTAVRTVTVNTPVQVTVSNPTTCKNIVVNITASGESSYTWAPSAGLNQTTGATVSVTNPTATTSYTVAGTDGNGCTSTAVSTVTVNTPVQVTVSSPTTCKNIPINITASGESSYIWTPSTDLNQTTGATVSAVNPTVTTSYTVTGTDANGCTSTAVSKLTVNNPVQVIVSSPITCKNIAVNITASGESSYTWAPSTGLNQTTGAPVSVTNPTATTSYTVTGTDGNGCTSTAVSTVTVNTPVQVTVSNPTTCKNIVVNITASGESSYTWAPSAGLNQTTGATVSVTNPTATTSYTVAGTDGNGCTSTAVSTVTVNTPVQVTVSSPTTCKNIAVNITASSESSYTWAPSTGLNQTTGATVSVTNPTATTSYTVTGTDGNGCTSTAVSTVTVNTPVQVTVSSPTTCKNIAVNITASGESSYTWAPSAGLNQTTGATVSVTNPTATTSYTVTGTDGNGCTSTAVSTVTVNTPVQVTVSSPTTCKNIAVNITASGESSYTWASSAGLNQTTGATVSVTNPTATTSYTVTGTDGNGCTSTAVSTVTVNTPVQVTVSSPTTCKNIAVSITASGESSYTWAPSTGLSATTGATVSVTNPTATTSYTVTGTDGNGCTSTAVSTVTVNPLPSANAGSNQIICLGSNISIGSPIVPGDTYSWNPASGLNNSTASNPTASPAATATYTLTETITATNCTASNSVIVSVNDTPTATILGPNTVCSYQNANLTLNANAGSGSITSYQWYMGGSQINGATSSAYTATASGGYAVSITNSNNCTGSSSAFVLNITSPLSIQSSVIEVACKSAADGSIKLTVSGGSPSYSYSWSNGRGNTDSIGGLIAANYSVTVYDANLCSATQAFTITQPRVLALTPHITDITCYGLSNGSIYISPSGGTIPYTYSWNNNSTAQSLSNLGRGLYKVTVTDVNGCSAASSDSITQPPPIKISAGIQDVSCYGGANGAINLSTTGGTPLHIASAGSGNGTLTYIFDWSNGTHDPDDTGLTAGIYTVTIMDSHGCAGSDTFTVSQPDSMKLMATINAPSCFGFSDGSINISIQGGTSPYTYSWSNDSATQNISGLTTGKYFVTVTDSNGCSLSRSFNVTQPTPLTMSGATFPVTCSGGNNGLINLAVSGGTSPYTYTWSDGDTRKNVDGLITGQYSVILTDANKCSVTDTFHIGQPSSLSFQTIDGSVIPPTCYGFQNGALNISVSGGSTPYTYSWNNGATTKNISGLGAGSYSVTVTDSNKCTLSQTTLLSNPPKLIFNIVPDSVVNANCNSDKNGALNISVSGGTPNYTYSWSNGATTPNISGVAAGSYSVTVNDVFGCSITKTLHVGQPNPLSFNTIADSVVNANCYGDRNGAVNISVSGGTTPYTYSWSNGTTTQNISSLGANTYSVTVTDAHHCSISKTLGVGQPNQLIISGAPITNVSCNGGANGAIDLTISGGTTPYTYSWSNGNTTANNDGIDSGSYLVTVTDAHGCSVKGSYNVSQPKQLAIAGAPVTNVSCNGGANGAIDLTISGGTTPYTYSWSNGNTTAHNDGIDSGSYSVTVTDAHGCLVTGSYNVSQPKQLAIAIPSITEAGCKGTPDGAVNISVSGGTTPYTYSWNNGNTTANNDGIGSGTYNVTVTDAHGCSVTGSYNVSQPSQLAIASAPVTNVSCKGGTNGAIDLTISGGTTPYTYSWSNGNTTANNDGIDSGSYSVTITDAHGCSVTGSYNVSQPKQLVIASAPVTNVSCKGGTNGAIDLTISGGTTPYTYSWSNGNTTANNDGIDSGAYSVTVTDAHGCSVTGSYNVSQPKQLAIAGAPVTNVSCNGGSNGAIDLTMSGGTIPYTYSWSNGNTTAHNDGIDSGSYSVTVTDAHGCSVTGSYSVSQPKQLTIASAPVTNVSCNGGANGAIDLTISGGTTPYTYSWNNGKATANNDGIDSGAYSVTVTDAHGCSVTGSYNVLQPKLLAISGAPVINVSCKGGSNGAIDLTISGGTTPYTYSWSNGNTAANNDGIDSGSYSVTVTDAHGCSVTGSYNVSQPKQLIVASAPVTNVSCNGGSNGAIDLTVSGGTTPYTYSWSNGNTAANNDGIDSGSYSVTVTDAHGCSVTGSYSVSQPSKLAIASAPVTKVSCNGRTDGAIDLTISGGTTPYTYSWDNGNTSANNDGIALGSYSVTVTDAHNCSVTGSYHVSQPDQLAVTRAPVTNVSCNGGTDGAVDITLSGGTSGYTYSWSNGNTTANNDGIGSGSYDYTVTDNNGCTANGSVTVDQPAPLTANVSKTDVECSNSCNGTATVTASGGTAPYSITWNDKDTSFSRTGLCGGNYNFTVTDKNGCTSANSITINQSGSVTVTSTKTNLTCNELNGLCDGSISLSVSGGVTPYTITWGANLYGATSAVMTNLCPDTYCYTVTDANGCSAIGCDTISEPNPLLIASNCCPDNITCHNACNGKINISIYGGVAPFTYSWSGPNGYTSADSNIHGLCPGVYAVTVTDANGCSYDNTHAPLINPDSIISNISGTNPTICKAGSCNGSANVSPSGGTGPYTITWANGSTNSSVTGLCSGETTVTITDFYGCTIVDSVNLNECKCPAVTATASNATCYGACNGSITLHLEGGATHNVYTVAWLVSNSNLPADTVLNNLCFGTYSYTVTFVNANCTKTGSVNVGQADSIAVIVNKKDIHCSDKCNGSIILAVSGGTAPYTYAWNIGDGYNFDTLTGLCGGTYCYTVTDAMGCTEASCVTIIQTDSLVVKANKQNETCYGTCNGSIGLSVSGGTAPYTYAWDIGDGYNVDTLTGLCAGKYCYTVTDQNGCSRASCVRVSQPDTIHVIANRTNLTCNELNGLCDGTISLSVSGGTTPYSITWGSNLYGATGADMTSLCPDTYCYTVTDANGCSEASCVTITEPTPLLIASNCCADDITCYNACNGKINISIYGGTAPFTYSWTGPNGYTSTDSNIHNLCAGIYSVTVTDHNGCSYDNTHAPLVNPAPIVSNIKGTNASTCDGGVCDGSASVSPSGGTAPYTYTWSMGDGYNYNTVTGLCAGEYFVTISDQLGCSTMDSVHISCRTTICDGLHVQISGPTNVCGNGTAMLSASPVANATSYSWTGPGGFTASTDTIHVNASGTYYVDIIYSPSSCHGKDSIKVTFNTIPTVTVNSTNISCEAAKKGTCDGTISLAISGVNTYTVLWSGPNSFSSYSTGLTQLCQGTYCYTVNSNGCNVTGCVQITLPPVVEFTINSTNVTCTGASNGTAAVVITGEGYTYKWNNGATTASISGLMGGKYCVTVTNATGCSASQCVTIDESGPIAVNVNTVNASCYGSCNGSATATGFGGTAPYNYKWNNGATTAKISGLCAANYCVTVTATGGCSISKSITISQPAPIDVTVKTTPPSCDGSCNGTACLTISGGIAPYTYSWSTGATTATVSGLCVGSYSVTVTGHGGCTGTSNFTISESSPMALGSIVTNVVCGGNACTGSISIYKVTGSISPYTYKWSNGGNADLIQGLCAGKYCVTVTGSNGCSISQCFTITTSTPISIAVTQTNVTCNGSCNGTANVAVEGGTAPYAYHWSNGACTSSICGLCAGQYTVTVTGCGGCSTSKCITITQPVPICVTVNTTTINCYGSDNSAASLVITGGIAPYTYKWSTGATTSTLSGLGAGSYSVTVTSHTGCSVIKCFTISQPQVMVATIKSTNVVCGGKPCSGSIAIPEVTGSMAPYAYKWNNGDKTDYLTNLCANTYDVTVTSATGCTIAKSVIISPCNENNARTEESATQNGEAADSSDDSNTLNLYPNPFDNKASIDLISSEDMTASLDIFNMSGEKVVEIYHGKMVGGQKYTFTFNAGILPSGMYICRLSSEKGVQSVNVVKVLR